MKKILFKGVATALVTPFKQDGSLDSDQLKPLIDHQINNGIQGIVIAGTTGEASTLSFEEYSHLIAEAAAHINHKVPLIAGSGSNNTAHTLKISLEAEKRGADALLIVTPYYNKTTQEGLIKHYFYVADRVRIPIILYNIPQRTGLKIEPETLNKLLEHPNIIGIKDASGNISTTADYAALKNKCAIYSGNDDQILPILSLGGQGVISVVSNIAPQETQNIYNHFNEGNLHKAVVQQLTLLPLIRLLFSKVNPIPIKAAMKVIGISAGDPRLPLIPCDDHTIEMIRREIHQLGIIS